VSFHKCVVPRVCSRVGLPCPHTYVFFDIVGVSQLRRTLALLEQAFRLRRLRFEARYGGGKGGNAADDIGGGALSLSAAQVQYHTAVQRCIRVLEGQVVEVIAEMEVDGLAQNALALRSISSTPTVPYAGAGGKMNSDAGGGGGGGGADRKFPTAG